VSLRDPLKIARGLGSAKNGTGHWWTQRLTALALLLLTPWFLWLALGLVGADHYAVRMTLARPLTATLLLAYVLSMFWHAQLGLQVVIEDYVHGWIEILLQVLVKLAYAIGAIACVVALARIVFSA
jgi:succinate dehydrogenase / fumarate reductase membrane anchor subunit